MKLIRSLPGMRAWTEERRQEGKRIALVPTMGALHAGHLSLIELARRKADLVVVSIYVNPTQFGPKEDLKKYPRPLQQDLQLCREEDVAAVWAPKTLYEKTHSTWVEEDVVSQGGEGAQRPGHLRGVATVVLKLFNVVQPQVAVFGHKDAQQWELVQRVVRDLNVPIQLEAGEIVRDRDGLALSSRNVYLSEKERAAALALPLLLRLAVGRPDAVGWLRRELERAPSLRLDYVEIRNGRLCAAVRVGRTRLLDNVPCGAKQRKI
jgi:pantoate--beta-alanine ligase